MKSNLDHQSEVLTVGAACASLKNRFPSVEFEIGEFVCDDEVGPHRDVLVFGLPDGVAEEYFACLAEIREKFLWPAGLEVFFLDVQSGVHVDADCQRSTAPTALTVEWSGVHFGTPARSCRDSARIWGKLGWLIGVGPDRADLQLAAAA